MTKQERLQQYKELYPDYVITDIRKMTEEEINSRYNYGKQSLDELYASPSNAKEASYRWILNTYKPVRQGLLGGTHTYSVLLDTDKDVTMLITKNNNYIIERV